MLLLIDTQKLLEKQKEAEKLSAKELDNLWQEKKLRRQIKEARKLEQLEKLKTSTLVA